MMFNTPNLTLPYIAPAQAQKHVTHNDAIRMLDALIQLSVLESQTAPPIGPNNGDRYIVAANASGIWAGHETDIAVYQDGAWCFFPAQPGWVCWNNADQTLLVYASGVWGSAVPETVDSFPKLGINATADSYNKLSVKSPAILLDNIGAGHQCKINKANVADTASLLLQTGYGGRAELGLLGDDDLRIKVSVDGNNWTDVLSISAPTGALTIHTSALRDGHEIYDAGNTPDILNLKGQVGANEDLNAYTDTGMWEQSLDAQAVNGQNYPASKSGLLTVIATSSSVYQTYRTSAGGGSVLADATFTRGKTASTWTAWKQLAEL